MNEWINESRSERVTKDRPFLCTGLWLRKGRSSSCSSLFSCPLPPALSLESGRVGQILSLATYRVQGTLPSLSLFVHLSVEWWWYCTIYKIILKKYISQRESNRWNEAYKVGARCLARVKFSLWTRWLLLTGRRKCSSITLFTSFPASRVRGTVNKHQSFICITTHSTNCYVYWARDYL